MGRCVEFYQKWEKTPNWCNKCRSSAFTIDKYIEMVKKLEDAGAKFAYANLSENQIRKIPKKQMDLYVPEIVELVKNIPKRKITDGELKAIHKKIHTNVPADYNEFESPPREVKKRYVHCPYCGRGFYPEKAKKEKKVSPHKTPEITEKEQERRKARVRETLDLEWEIVDLDAEWDSNLTYAENLRQIRINHGISKEPNFDKIKQEQEEFYEKNPLKENMEI